MEISQSIHGYFDDFWRQGSGNQLVSGGEVSWEKAVELGTKLTVNPFTVDDARTFVKRHEALAEEEVSWHNADIEPANP